MPEDRKTFADLAHEALARDPNWLYGEVLPIAKNRQTGEYSAALPGMIRDYLGGWADLITGPQVGENLSPQAVLSILGPGAHAAAGSPSVVIGPGARAFNWAKAFRSPINSADEIARNAIDDSSLMFHDKDLLLNHSYKLNDVIDHPELFENYPDLKDVGIRFPDKMPFGSGVKGAMLHPENTMLIAGNNSDADLLGTILHETQHWIQAFEGMNRGNNPHNYLPQDFQEVSQAVMNLNPKAFPPGLQQLRVSDYKKEIENMLDTAHGRYSRTPGEMEARAVQEAFIDARQSPLLEPPMVVDKSIPEGWGFVSNKVESTPRQNLPFPYNFLDFPASEGLEWNRALRQEYSPELYNFSNLLKEALQK